MAPEQIPPFGCTVSDDGSATFVYQDMVAERVYVAGDFNGWSKDATPLAKAPGSDLWVGRTGRLPAGVHGYKYVVDGRWMADPAQALDAPDGLGGRNSAFVSGLRPLGDARAIRVLSLNLHTYQERAAGGDDDSLRKLEQIAFGAAVAGVDVLLLQEVGEHVSSPSHPNAGDVLRRHLERFTRSRWSHEWREAHIGFDVYREGLSVLSATPIEDLAVLQLSEGPLARIALACTVAAKDARLRVATTHVTWGSAGHAEVKRLLELLRGLGGSDHAATLITGDFNAAPGEPQIGELVSAGYVDVAAAKGAVFATHGDGDGTAPRPPSRRIDYHFLRTSAGWGAPGVETFQRVLDGAPPHDGLDPRVSDHTGILAAYTFESRPISRRILG